ncbi:MAG: hypothetical protein JW829_00640 [Pirellulales bacterium]|nr:hypothetical protein [Pirellulales bacterium]
MKGQYLDLSSDPAGAMPASPDPPRGTDLKGRRFVGVHFTCCDIYLRIYINRDETGYDGRCPRCGRFVHFRIGPGGINDRFFTAS